MTKRKGSNRLPHLAGQIGEDYADGFAACRELLASMFELQEPEPEQRAGYATDFALYDYGPIKLGTSTTATGVPWTMVRGLPLIARTGVDHFHIQSYRSGGFAMSLDGVERRVEAGDIAMLDLARPVTLRAERIDNLSAIIDRELLAPLLADVDDVHGLVLARDSETGIAVREHLEEMWQQAPELTRAQGLERSRSAAALFAAVIRAKEQSRQSARAELRKSQFRAICRRIDRDIADPGLDAGHLCRAFNMSRPTLYRLFEPHGGIGRYVLGRRLAGVFRDLSGAAIRDGGIETVLRRWGFSSHTAAGRAFREAYGMTPSQCRARARDLRRQASGADAHAFEIPPEMPAKVAVFRRADRRN